MIGTRAGKIAKLNYQNLTGMKDKETEGYNFPAQYMFKDVPWSNQARNFEEQPEPPQGSDLLLPYMDKHNIEIAMIGVGLGQERSGAREAIEQYPDRFIGCHEPDPNDVMGSIATIRELHENGYIKAYLHFQPEETLKYQSTIPRCTRCTRYVLNWTYRLLLCRNSRTASTL